MFDLRLYKQFFDEVKFIAGSHFRLDALIEVPNLDGSYYTSIGFAHGPLNVTLKVAANDGYQR